MLTIDQFAKKANLKSRTIKKAIKERRLRSERSDGGEVLIPDDEIAPLSKAQIQSFIWVILHYKNDSSAKPDISTVSEINQDQLLSVFKQLVYRKYVDSLDEFNSVPDCFDQCRVTSVGLALVESKPLPGSVISRKLAEQGVGAILNLVIQHLPAIIQVVQQSG